MSKRIHITKDTAGSPDGINTQQFKAGETIAMDDPRMSEQLAEVLVDAGTAEWLRGGVSDRFTKPNGPDETKPDGPEESKLDGMVVGDYKAPEGSSWKTFYDEDGFELGKAQVSKEGAEKAVDEGLTLEEVKAL